MASPGQVKKLKNGVEVWNQWREKYPTKAIDLNGASLYMFDLDRVNLSRADLTKANLGGAHLDGADLNGSYLDGADLSSANLQFANLTGARLVRADLYNANLASANLTRADLGEADLNRAILIAALLNGADLYKADLSFANLTRADLNKTNFREAKLLSTIFGGVDLSDADGLEKVFHYDSSIISTDTIQLSKGKIPISFLRGCGLSDLQIELSKLFAPGLDAEQVTDITYQIYQRYFGNPIQYYSCFISYNNKDEDFARRLHDDLQDNGVRCWFAPEDLKIGDRMRKTIGEQVRLRDKLLVILSENSIASEWVGHEVEKAFAEEKEQSDLKLFPIRLDDAVLKAKNDWAEAIRLQRHIADFSDWKNKISYGKSFERLLRDLKASSTD